MARADTPHVDRTSDYPVPGVVSDRRPFLWCADDPPAVLYPTFARRLAAAGDLFRRPGYASGLLLASPSAAVPPTEIVKGAQLAPVVIDRVPLVVIANGRAKGGRIPAADLSAMLGTELFLQAFRPVDRVIRRPEYMPGFELTRPGYNDGGPGQRVLYVGDPPDVATTPEAITAFLDVMAFASPADRTNAVAAALTVLLRNHWPGAKPLVAVTSSKSHGGKDTVAMFAAGRTPRLSISYERADWALQKAFVQAVKFDPEAGVVNVENARLDGGGRVASAFLERFLTDPEPLLFSPGAGNPVRAANHWVVALTTNFGALSEDLMNRALPVHLDPVGDVADRRSPVGNPKHEYLPANRARIEAELLGMVERWRREGMPLATSVRHPFTDWARVVGGILAANGLTDFLANYATRRTADDPVRRALGLLGAFAPDEWLAADRWAALVAHLGLTQALVPPAERESPESRRRAVGVVLTAHRGETLVADTDGGVFTLRLERDRRRFEPGQEPAVRYRFRVESHRPPGDGTAG